MGEFDTLALFASNDLTRTGLRDAAERRGLRVIPLDSDPGSVAQVAGPGRPDPVVTGTEYIGAD